MRRAFSAKIARAAHQHAPGSDASGSGLAAPIARPAVASEQDRSRDFFRPVPKSADGVGSCRRAAQSAHLWRVGEQPCARFRARNCGARERHRRHGSMFRPLGARVTSFRFVHAPSSLGPERGLRDVAGVAKNASISLAARPDAHREPRLVFHRRLGLSSFPAAENRRRVPHCPTAEFSISTIRPSQAMPLYVRGGQQITHRPSLFAKLQSVNSSLANGLA